jgi:hypothetical protein
LGDDENPGVVAVAAQTGIVDGKAAPMATKAKKT